MALYHCVYPEENFERAAREIFDLVAHTIEFFPSAKRSLYLDIEGHRTPTDAFDDDMFELQKKLPAWLPDAILGRTSYAIDSRKKSETSAGGPTGRTPYLRFGGRRAKGHGDHSA